MSDWYGNRAKESYTYRRVKWSPGNPDHLHESADYGNVTSGKVELSAFSDLKATCSFEFMGTEVPDTIDLVRIYYGFEDDAGVAEEPVKLRNDEYFVLGDNRNNSEDSRFADVGNIKKSYISGKVWYLRSPSHRRGFL